jgi:hypothetical protein
MNILAQQHEDAELQILALPLPDQMVVGRLHAVQGQALGDTSFQDFLDNWPVGLTITSGELEGARAFWNDGEIGT